MPIFCTLFNSEIGHETEQNNETEQNKDQRTKQKQEFWT